MKNIDVFFTTAVWDEYLECIQSALAHAENNLRGLVKASDDCSICAITICLVCMFDDVQRDREFGRKMESLAPWKTDKVNGNMSYNLGICLCIPSNLFLNFNKHDFSNHCKDEFIKKFDAPFYKKIKNFDFIPISEMIFNNMFQ